MKTKHYFFQIISLLLLLATSSCGGVNKSSQQYDTIYAPTHARHFVVLSQGDKVILRVKNPWQGAKNIHFDYTFNETPTRIITMSSSHSAFIAEMGLESHIVGVSGPQYLSNKTLQNLPDVGYDNNLNYEVIVSLKPDLVARYEITGENSPGTEKLRSMGVKVIYIADYLEQSPLAKAEWIVAFGAMMNELEKSQEIFKSIDTKYTTLRKEIDLHYSTHVDSLSDSCALCKGPQKRPVVMLNSPYNDVWYLPGDSSYMVELVRDAGGIYAARGEANNISRSVSIETAYTLLEASDIWLNPSAAINSKNDIVTINPLLGKIKIPVYNNTAREGKSGGSDFWESGVLRCDLVLMDLIAILHPELLPNHKLYYYKKLD